MNRNILFSLSSIFFLAIFVFLSTKNTNAQSLTCLSLSYTPSLSAASPNTIITMTAVVTNSCGFDVGAVDVWAKYDDFSLVSTGGFADQGGGNLLATTPGIEPGGVRQWSWQGRVNGNCPVGNNEANSLLELYESGTSNLLNSSELAPRVSIYAGINVSLQNNDSIGHNYQARVKNRFGTVVSGPFGFSAPAGGSGFAPQIFDINCSQGPFTVEWSADGGAYRTDSTSPQNFNAINGCLTNVDITYNPVAPTPPPPTPPPPTPTPTPTPPPTEICGNGIDDDLDGLIDEGCGGIGVDIKADGNDSLTIPAPGNVTLSWTTFGGPSWCVSSANWGGGIVSGAGGSQVVSVSANTTFSIICQKPGELDANDSVTVNVSSAPTPGPTPVPTPAPSEICGDGIDNNGNGVVDEGCGLRGSYSTVSLCQAYGEIVATVGFLYMSKPPAITNLMQIRTGSRFGPIIATIDPWPASQVKIAGIFSPGATYFFQGYLIDPSGFSYVDDPPASVIADVASMPICPGIVPPTPSADLSITSVGMVDPVTGTPKTAFIPGEPAKAIYMVHNPGTTSITTNVGFWPTGGSISTGGSGPLPVCPGSAGVPATFPAALAPINQAFAPGDTLISFDFTVPSSDSAYFAHAFVSYTCLPDEGPVAGSVPWGNNDTTLPYTVSAGGWFKIIDGDVGAAGSISAIAAPASGFSANFLLAGSSLSSKVTTERWRLDTYSFSQVSSPVYQYMESRFRIKAETNICTTDGTFAGISEIGSSSNPIFNYCGGDVNLNQVTNVPAGSSYVWFIDGNLIINKNITVPSSSTVVFIVKGDVTVDSSVDRVDGIYVAGGTFIDVTTSATGPQLKIDGAVYAGQVVFSRKCDGTCNSTTDPVEIITFQPRYIEALNNILGFPAISWQEVAP